jgi:hypothetical protein
MPVDYLDPSEMPKGLVAFVFESDTLDQSGYQEFLKQLGMESIDAPGPPGAIAHLAGPRPEGGWRVIDVWESEGAANAFYGSDRFRPVREGASDMRTTPWPLHRVVIDQTIRHQS